MKHIKQKKGVTLLVLVITIIVMIILAGSVILSLKKSNTIGEAGKVKFEQEVKEFSKALQLELDGRELEDDTFDPYKVNVTEYTKMKEYIKNFTAEYEGKLVIKNGKLVYVGTDRDEIEWVKEAGIAVE